MTAKEAFAKSIEKKKGLMPYLVSTNAFEELGPVTILAVKESVMLDIEYSEKLFAQIDEKEFPNGFKSWQNTHHEIVERFEFELLKQETYSVLTSLLSKLEDKKLDVEAKAKMTSINPESISMFMLAIAGIDFAIIETKKLISEEVRFGNHKPTPKRISEIQESQGRFGVMSEASFLADKFESKNKGREWDGEWIEEIQSFLDEELAD